ncbi:MAG: T9SS type A sorting domain-containing protein [Bacteroidales bacterium]
MRNLFLLVLAIIFGVSVYAEKRIYFFYGWDRETSLPSFDGEALDYRPGGGNYYENWGRNTLIKSTEDPYRPGESYTKIAVTPPASASETPPYPTYAGVFVNGRQTIVFDGVRDSWYLHFAIKTDHKGSFNLLFYENWKWGAQKTFNINKYIVRTDGSWCDVNIPVSDMIDAGLEILSWDMRYDATHDPYLYYLGFEGVFDKGITTTHTSLDDMYFTDTTPTSIQSVKSDASALWRQSGYGLRIIEDGNCGITIYDMVGKIIRTTPLSEIDLTGLQPGCYIAKSGSNIFKFKY